MAAVHGRQHPLDTSLISSTTNPNTSKYLQDNCGNGDWYTVSKALLIRMNFGTISSVEEEINKDVERRLKGNDTVISLNPYKDLFK